MVNINSKDLSFTEDGDFFFKSRSGLEESGYENNQLLIEKLILRIQSSSYDWGTFVPETANLDYFRGAPVTDSTLNEMQNRIYETITADGLVDPSSVIFDEAFLTVEGIGFSIFIIAEPNELPQNVNIGFSYNLETNRMIAKVIGR